MYLFFDVDFCDGGRHQSELQQIYLRFKSVQNLSKMSTHTKRVCLQRPKAEMIFSFIKVPFQI